MKPTIPHLSHKERTRHLERARKFADLLDSRFSIPGTKISFGIDPIIGLVPGVGDAVTLVMQSMLVVTLFRTGASGKLVALMFVNVLVDTVIGAIPVVGQIVDFFFKASNRNLRLTEDYLYEGKHRGSGLGIWLAIIALVIITIVLVIWAIVAIFSWIIGLF